MEEYLETLEKAAMDSEAFEAMLSDDLKKIWLEVKAELVEINPDLKEFNILTELDEDTVNQFCERNSIEVFPNFKGQLKTPFAITKYVSLIVQQKELTNKIDNSLKVLLDASKISWVIHQNFTNTITFTKILPINSDEKPQSLLIKYRLDPETDKIIYTIAAGNWGWDITASQLKSLLENTAIVQSIENIDKFTYSISDKDIIITAGGIEISVKKR